MKRKGFTLVELLVVISVIGILLSVVLARYQISEKQARDTKRRSDLSQYRIALENYSSAHNFTYPVVSDGSADTLCSALETDGFIASCLTDPRDLGYVCYSDGVNWVLGATLESGGFWEICSNGKVGKPTPPTVLPTSASCNL